MLLKHSVFLFSFLFVLPVFAQPAQGVLLLKTWQPAQDVRGWLMSEKLDGVRAYWDGQKLISRGGKIFSAPAWFIKDFPPFALDGELWSKRRDFENIVSIVRRKNRTPAGSRFLIRFLTYQIRLGVYRIG